MERRTSVPRLHSKPGLSRCDELGQGADPLRPAAAQGLQTLGATMPSANLYDDVPAELPQELASTLLSAGRSRIERIVSHGHSSPPDFWYDQAEHEWVLLLRGAA